jgi:hypothetical protein
MGCRCSHNRNFEQSHNKFELINMIEEENLKIKEYLKDRDEKTTDTMKKFSLYADKFLNKLKTKIIPDKELEILKNHVAEFYDCFPDASIQELKQRKLKLEDFINYYLFSSNSNI